jgi:hypothetical protein
VGRWYWETTREGQTISRAGSAVLFATLIFLLSAATAHARPSLGLAETGARADDVVHFSIYGLDGDVNYEVEVDGEWVTDGWGDGVISDAFTMPDLGAGSWTVTVEVKLRGHRKVSGELEYLGRALPVVKTPAPAPAAPEPTAAAQAVPSPAISSPKAIEGSSTAPAVTPQPSPMPHRSYVRRVAYQQKAAHRKTAGAHKPHRTAHRKRARRTRHSARWFARAWLRAFRAAPYPGGRARSGANERRDDGGRIFSLNAIAPHTAALAATAARAGGGGANTAVVAPALLGLAAFTLAGTAVGRRRRLASRSRRD